MLANRMADLGESERAFRRERNVVGGGTAARPRAANRLNFE